MKDKVLVTSFRKLKTPSQKVVTIQFWGKPTVQTLTRGLSFAMKNESLVELSNRLRVVELQNRFLLVSLFVIGGISLMGASSSSAIIPEVRTMDFILVDNHGKPLVESRGKDGVEYHAYLPHNVVQEE